MREKVKRHVTHSCMCSLLFIQSRLWDWSQLAVTLEETRDLRTFPCLLRMIPCQLLLTCSSRSRLWKAVISFVNSFVQQIPHAKKQFDTHPKKQFDINDQHLMAHHGNQAAALFLDNSFWFSNSTMITKTAMHTSHMGYYTSCAIACSFDALRALNSSDQSLRLRVISSKSIERSYFAGQEWCNHVKTHYVYMLRQLQDNLATSSGNHVQTYTAINIDN